MNDIFLVFLGVLEIRIKLLLENSEVRDHWDNIYFSMMITLRECLLSFGAESVVFQVAIQKLKDQDI
jgi:hypothetical protein